MSIHMMDSWTQEDCESWQRGDRERLPWRVLGENATLMVYEANYYDDSDFYAIYWDAEAYRPQQVQYATTRGWTYPNSAWVDATPEVVAKAKDWVRPYVEERIRHLLEMQAETPDVASVVRVVKGRKVPIGATGSVFWRGPDRFDPNRYRIGFEDFADASTKWFTAETNVEVVNPPEVDPEDVARRVEAWLTHPDWRQYCRF